MTEAGQVLDIPFADAFAFDPSPTWAAIRESDRPVVRVRTLTGSHVWLATRYDHVRLILSDPRFSRAAVVADGAPRAGVSRPLSNTLPTTDPPEHTRLRRLVSGVFAPRRVEALRPAIRELAGRLADDVAAAGQGADLRQLFALPLPIQVICSMLGVPYADREAFREWTELAYSMEVSERARVESAMGSLVGYMTDLVVRKRIAYRRGAHGSVAVAGAATKASHDADAVTARGGDTDAVTNTVTNAVTDTDAVADADTGVVGNTATDGVAADDTVAATGTVTTAVAGTDTVGTAVADTDAVESAVAGGIRDSAHDHAEDTGGDLLDELCRTALTDDELVAFALNLLVAGHETSANQITSFVATLLRDPALWDRLVRDPGLLPSAVEELMRVTRLSDVGQLRIAKQDVELGGVTVRAGEGVMASIGAANRDPRVFPDPDTVRLDRAPNPHLALGVGIHFCLGAQLARIELGEALSVLINRFPRLRPARPIEDLAWRRVLVSGLAELPVLP
ncbi:hypothetical protein GCM10022243_35480 [Saccharothrix violaceirubra]|uniref:Cytochrome P450 n=1 Tax=Saccharothrix violaceirubra TaxID=413306 RepID=A0A7W7SZN0_9PSEU|nr:cytochrome P450 [Saccharothrix violaceirubra]MBB4963921.1 cytochrome P450 [Saccharothrix violaceirubra]